MKRRSFLVSAAALAVLPMTPPLASAPRPIAGELVVGFDGGALPARAPWWGWSSNQEFWHGPFDSREEAAADAEDNEDAVDGFDTALCYPRTLSHPDYREDIATWLADDSRHAHWTLSQVLANGFEGSNEDHDFEGEVSEAIGQADWGALAVRVEPLIDAAVMRTGLFVAGPWRGGLLADAEPLFVALQHDEVFARELAAAAAAWSDGNGLLTSTLMVDLTDEQSVPCKEESVVG